MEDNIGNSRPFALAALKAVFIRKDRWFSIAVTK